MLEFFRKYQSYFFIVISVVIIISFSFFGTYNTIPASSIHEAVAFTAVDGTQVNRSELDELAYFIGTDAEDKLLFGGAWGPNFLNDGVIKNDILQTGLGQILAEAYPDLIERDLQMRLAKEKHFNLYAHPQAPFLTIENAWTYMMPDMKGYYDTLRRADNPVSSEAFEARVNLFLGERQFPAPLLRQVLKYQQKQFSWLKPDPNLDRIDLSLFGYHTVDDWFGPRFLRLVGEFIINSSKIAEQKGYVVTKNEALADLMHNAQVSFQQNAGNPNLGVTSSSEYFNEQLRRLGMDQTKAVKVWRQVLLFRRLFQDVGNAALIDPLTHQKFYEYAKETVRGDLYRLPPEFRFADYRGMQKFQVYLDAVAKRPKNELALPTSFLEIAEVKKKSPELIQKRYVLQVAQVSKTSLQSKVGLKEMWNWEVADQNWAQLKKEFPELGLKKGNTREERFAALDSLDDATRGRVDVYARKEIVEAHPEWLQETLQNAEPTQMDLGLSAKGGKPIFELDNREELMQLLDEAPLGEQPSGKLAQLSGDDDHYYRVAVVEKSPDEEILTYAEANDNGVLDQLLDKQLEAYYVKHREGKAEFQKEDKSYKAFADVKDKLADAYFEKVLAAIRKDYASANPTADKQLTTGNQAAPYRFYSYVRDIKKKLQDGKIDAETLLKSEAGKDVALEDQWKLEKTAYHADRSRQTNDVDLSEMFTLPINGWTQVNAPANGDIYFLHLTERAYPEDLTALYDTLHEAHDMMANDAQRVYMYQVVDELKTKNAISLNYLDTGVEITPEETADNE